MRRYFSLLFLAPFFLLVASCLYSTYRTERPAQVHYEFKEAVTAALEGPVLPPVKSIKEGLLIAHGSSLFRLNSGLNPVWSYDVGGTVDFFEIIGENRFGILHSGNVYLEIDPSEMQVLERTELPANCLFGPVRSGGNLLFFLDDGTVFTGGGIYELEDVPAAEPFVEKELLFYGTSGGELVCFDRGTGTVLWTFAAGNAVRSPPLKHGKRLYFGSDDAWFYCLNPENGRLIWKLKTGGSVRTKAAVIDGVLYMTSFDSILYALDPMDGKRLWERGISNRPDGPPLAVNGNILLKPLTAKALYLFDGREGVEKGTYVLKDERDFLTAGPCESGGRIYVGTYLGKLIGLEAERIEKTEDTGGEDGEEGTYSFEKEEADNKFNR